MNGGGPEQERSTLALVGGSLRVVLEDLGKGLPALQQLVQARKGDVRAGFVVRNLES